MSRGYRDLGGGKSKFATVLIVAISVILVIILLGINSLLSLQIEDLKNQLNEKNNTITSLHSEIIEVERNITNSFQIKISALEGQLNEKNNTIASLQNKIADLENQTKELNSIVNLEKSEVWINKYTITQSPNSYISWTFSPKYGGYVSVVVHSSTTNTTYARVKWSSYGVNYENTITIGLAGTAVFPVLPTSNLEIKVGNANSVGETSLTVSVIYHY